MYKYPLSYFITYFNRPRLSLVDDYNELNHGDSENITQWLKTLQVWSKGFIKIILNESFSDVKRNDEPRKDARNTGKHLERILGFRLSIQLMITPIDNLHLD